MNGSSNLIIGHCAQLPFDRLAPFIASLRNTNFAGDICLLVQDVAAETIARLRGHGIIVERASPSAQPGMAAGSSRYFSYLDFLLRRGEQYTNVLLTDPASTIVEADPFATPQQAEVLYTALRRRIIDAPTAHDAVVRGYGEAVAHNIRDCMLSNADTTLGTRSGILRYLAAVAHQLAGRSTPITGAMDQGVHNYVVHMHRLRGAWLDTTDQVAAAVNTLPIGSVDIAEHGVSIGGRTVPLLSHWDADAGLAQHVRTAPRYLLSRTPEPRPAPSATDAVVAYYLRQRDRGWLDMFLGSLRCVSNSAAVHCIGDFDQDDLAIVARHNCIAYVVPATEEQVGENVAHFYLSQVLDRMQSDATAQPDQVMVIDGTRGIFLGDPFLTKTVGVSVFCEGAARIGDSGYTRARLEHFVAVDENWLRRPVVSSRVMRAPLSLMREFYRRMFAELVGRAELLGIHHVVQGLLNKLCHSGELDFPVIIHPNGAEVYFDRPDAGLAVDTRHGVRIGGTVPALVLADHLETPLMLKARIDLNLPQT